MSENVNKVTWMTDSRDRLTHVIGPSGEPQQIGGLAGGSDNWPILTLTRELRALLPSFGSGAPDAQVSRTETGTSYYYDTNRGSDAANGLSAAAARRTVPQYIANNQNNAKVYIAAGSVLTLPMIPVNTGCTITVYEGDPTSPRFGQEIIDQPNPFVRALLGGWVTQEEIDSKYFTVRPGFGALALGSQSLTVGAALNSNSCPRLTVRGAVFEDCVTGAILQGSNSATVRLEDCVFRYAQTDPALNDTNFGGMWVRVTGSAGNAPAVSMARIFFEGAGEDGIWALNNSAITGSFYLSDFAAMHLCEQQRYSSQHADFLQMGGRPGAFTVRRGVVRHELRDAPLIEGAGSLASTGGIFVSTGTSGDQTGTGGLFEDCLLMSNSQIANVERQPGVTFRRCISVTYGDNPGREVGVNRPALLTNQFTGTIVEDGHITAFVGSPSERVWPRASINGGAAGTQTNVTHVSGF